MKTLLVLLIEKIDGEWWRLRVLSGTHPTDVHEGHYVFTVLRQMIRYKLKKFTEKNDAKVDP